MGIRSRTIVLIAATGLILWIALMGAGIVIGDRASNGIDRVDVVNALQQAKAVLHYDTDQVNSVVSDWATWDDAYRFVRDHNKAFIRSNLTGESLPNLGVDFMVFIDRSDNIVYAAAVDPITHEATSTPAAIVRYIQGKPSLLHFAHTTDSVSGLLALPEGTFAVAVRPVTTSNGRAPPDGAILTGYRLDAHKTAHLQRLTVGPITVLSPDSFAAISRAMTATLEPPARGTKELVAVTGADRLVGHTVVTGIDGKPAVTLSVTMPRTAFMVTRSVVISAGSALGVLGMILAVMLAVTLDKTVLNRLTRLSSAVDRIGDSGDIRARLFVTGSDEISVLTADINGMLGKLGQFEAGLRREEELYRATFEHAAVGIAHVGIDGAWLRVNQRLCDILGYTRDELLGVTIADVAHPDDAAQSTEHFRGLVAGDEATYESVKRYFRKDGSLVWVNLSVALIRDELGPPAYFVAVLEDVTERRQAEEALRESENTLAALNRSLEGRVDARTSELSQAIEELTEANEAKTLFLRSMSHELRTPLNSVIGFSSMLADGIPGELNEEQLRQLGMIKNSGRHLLSLINDILDLSRIEAGRVEVTTEPVDIRDLVEDVVASVRPAAESKGLSLELDVPDPAPRLSSDRLKVRQILLNLTDNAIKFTNAGSVVLRAFQPSSHVVSFTVTDTGPGIRSEDLGRIFGEFERAANQAPTTEGTGLGLAISRGLAGSLGGTIDLVTEVGKGSTFTLTLPDEPGLSKA